MKSFLRSVTECGASSSVPLTSMLSEKLLKTLKWVTLLHSSFITTNTSAHSTILHPSVVNTPLTWNSSHIIFQNTDYIYDVFLKKPLNTRCHTRVRHCCVVWPKCCCLVGLIDSDPYLLNAVKTCQTIPLQIKLRLTMGRGRKQQGVVLFALPLCLIKPRPQSLCKVRFSLLIS